MKAAWALALLALATVCGRGARAPTPPTPRRARELHRPVLARPPVQPPPRIHRRATPSVLDKRSDGAARCDNVRFPPDDAS